MDEIQRKANQIANDALQDDENLLALAVAAPSVSIAVVQFRGQVEVFFNYSKNFENNNVILLSNQQNPTESSNHSFLGTYWKELGVAWNKPNGSQYWGAPFRDCGPLQGRWLWPFSVNVEIHGYKTVASSFIAADVDQCNDALELIFGRRHA